MDVYGIWSRIAYVYIKCIYRIVEDHTHTIDDIYIIY